MSTTQVFLLAMLLIFTLPWLFWRLLRTDHYAPLVVVQIALGIVLGPGVLGRQYPDYYDFVFTPATVQMLNGIANWGVMLFVWLAGIELDLGGAWHQRRECGITAGLALCMPLLCGAAVAVVLADQPGWMGPEAQRWQFVLGIGMSCAVTALPILVLFMEKLQILRQPLGQRILRYASLDDLAIWCVLALVLMDWTRLALQLAFMLALLLAGALTRRLLPRLPERDRLPVSLVWLLLCALGADYAGLHFMVGAFLAGAFLDSRWFDTQQLDRLRHHVLLLVMPVFFLSTGLRTHWSVSGASVFLVAAALLLAAVVGKLLGSALAGRILRWDRGEGWLIGWLLQTKSLIMIIFASVLLDRMIISNASFTALLLMALGSTMLTIPVVEPLLARRQVGGQASTVDAETQDSDKVRTAPSSL